MAEPRFIEPACPKGLRFPQRAFFVLTAREFWSLVKILSIKARSFGLPYCRMASQEGLLVGPSLSAPHAVMVLETLKACGLKEVIIFGWCGSLSPDLFPGEVFLPSRGHSFEGVSRHYPEAQSLPWSKGQETLKILLTESGFKVREGALASTDAPFRETEDFIIQLKKRRILAIDMEVSSLMQVGQALGIRISCALLVTDRLDKSWEDYRQKTQEVGLRIVRVIWDKLLCLPE